MVADDSVFGSLLNSPAVSKVRQSQPTLHISVTQVAVTGRVLKNRRRARLRWRKKGEGHSKRHLLLDTQGFVLEVRLHSAKVMDLKTASSSCWNPPPPIASRASQTCGWTPLYNGQDKGADWGGRYFGKDGRDRVRHPPKSRS